jgi:signal transduction histidine kinase/ligand-binding sensor domain-containing protein
MSRAFTGVVALVLCAPAAFALDPTRAPSQYVVTRWGPGSLPSNVVHALVQSRDRYLWLGTSAGLVRFDGAEFKVQSALAEVEAGGVSRLAERSDGTLFVGTLTGSFFEYKDGTARTIPIPAGNAYVSSLHAARDGGVWAGVPGRPPVRWQDGQAVVHPEMRDVLGSFAIAEDDGGGIWIGSRGLGLVHFEKGQVTRVPATEDIIQALCAGRQGALWIGTPHGLLRRHDGKIDRFTTKDGLSHDNVSALLEDRDGNLWVGTSGGGLSRYSAGRFSRMTMREGLSDDDVRSLLEDHEGNLWVGTADGLNCVGDGRFITYGRHEGLGEPGVSAVAPAAQGGAWLGLASGRVARLRKDGVIAEQHHLPGGGLGREAPVALRETRDGTLWIAQDNGRVFRLRAGVLSEHTPVVPRPEMKVRTLFEDEQGPVFLLSALGLARLDGRRLVPLPPARPLHYLRFPHSTVRDATGTLWVGDLYGLGRVRDGAWEVLTTKQGLPHNRVRWISAEKDGSLWAATAGGLVYWRDGVIRKVTAHEGLPESYLRVVIDDERGALWIASMGSVFRLEKKDVHDLFAGKIARVQPLVFDTSDGLRTTEGLLGNDPAFRAADGRIWLATAQGVSVIDPATLVTGDLAPEIRIEGMSVDGHAGTAGQEFAPGRGQVTIEYAARSYRSPQRVRFRHRLEGLDPAWVDAGTLRRAHYSSLPAGRYRFSVTASNRDGMWNREPVSVAFTIRPPFYQRPAFYASVIAALVAAVAGAYRVRGNRLRERFAAVLEERTRIARELHDTLAQGLAGVNLQIDAALADLPAEPALHRTRGHLEVGLVLIGASLSEVRRSIWVLRAQTAKDANDIVSSFEHHLEQLTEGSSVAPHFAIHGAPRPLSPAVEQSLLRIAHEAVTNVVRHAQARNAFVGLRFDDDALCLEVRDDGGGFELETTRRRVRGQRFGLVGMEERTRALGGEVRFRSAPGAGTEIVCRLPYDAGSTDTEP